MGRLWIFWGSLVGNFGWLVGGGTVEVYTILNIVERKNVGKCCFGICANSGMAHY